MPDIVLSAEEIRNEWDGLFSKDAYRCYKDIIKQRNFKCSERCMFGIHGSLEEEYLT